MSDGRDDTQARPAGGVRPSPDLLQKWSRAPYWGPDEGVALAFGLDPARVIKTDISGYGDPYLKARDPAPHFADFAHRAMAKGHLEHHAHPSDFIDWAEKVGLAFHDDWTSALPPRKLPEATGDAPEGDSEPLSNRDEVSSESGGDGSAPAGCWRAEVEAAYRKRVKDWPQGQKPPSGE